MSDEPEAQITMSRIPIRGGIGVFALIVVLVSGVLADLPQLRGRFLGGVVLGLLFGVALIVWRRRTMDAHTLPPGAHAMLGPEPTETAAARDRLPVGESRDRRERPITRPGAHPRVVPAS
jgi:hypothetical protein